MSEVLLHPNAPDLEPAPAAEHVRYARWHALKRRPTFLIAATIIAIMLVMAVVPGPIASLFGHGDPRNCNLMYSGSPPSLSSGHPFGFDIQGCDVYANVVYGARTSIPIGLL